MRLWEEEQQDMSICPVTQGQWVQIVIFTMLQELTYNNKQMRSNAKIELDTKSKGPPKT